MSVVIVQTVELGVQNRAKGARWDTSEKGDIEEDARTKEIPGNGVNEGDTTQKDWML